jgi:hypothetical protein
MLVDRHRRAAVTRAPIPSRVTRVARYSLRMQMWWFTRLTNEFSKKMESHAFFRLRLAACTIICCIHNTFLVTPAMAARVTDKLSSFADIVAVLEA